VTRDGRAHGFSLIELLIVIVIVGLLVGIAVPGYRQYVQRANRGDATAALLRIGAAQERFYLQNGRYAADTDEMRDAPPGGLGIEGTERNFYVLTMTDGDAVGFTATATVREGGSQGDDEDCWSFQINEQGQRIARDRGGAINDACWR
jgi:type IV pilus assembly protein PilE